MDSVICIVDGGYNNCHTDKGYGSFAIMHKNGKTKYKSSVFELPVRTSSEAEYYSLLVLLDYILKRSDFKLCSWVIKSDNQLMVNQINGRFRVLAKNLIPLHRSVIEMLNRIPYVKIKWVHRRKIKRVLGH